MADTNKKAGSGMDSETRKAITAYAAKLRGAMASETKKSSGDGNRLPRLLAQFAGFFPLLYVGQLCGEIADTFASGQIATLPDGSPASVAAPGKVFCYFCSKDYHGKPSSKEEQKPKRHLLNQNTFFTTASGELISVSQSCVASHLLPLAKRYNSDLSVAIQDVAEFAATWPDNQLSQVYAKQPRK